MGACLALFADFACSAQSDGTSEKRELTLVAAGTSLTARGIWPERLQEALSTCMSAPVNVVKIAKSGETTFWTLTQLDRIAAYKPSVVLIENYANDAAFNRFITLGRSRDNFGLILDGLRDRLPDVRVVVMGMNPFHGPRWLLRPFVDNYLEAHRREAEKRGFVFLDFRPEWGRFDDETLKSLIPDGGHPLPEAAAKVMIPGLLRLLSENGNKC